MYDPRNDYLDVTEAAMDSQKRRSLLQLKILTHLSKQEARSVVELATALGTHRPSVSRSLRSLQSESLVAHEDGTWRLTPDGSLEAATVSDRLLRTIEEATATAERITKSLPHIELPTLTEQATKAFAALNSLALTGEVAKTAAGLSSILESTQAASALAAISENSNFAKALAAYTGSGLTGVLQEQVKFPTFFELAELAAPRWQESLTPHPMISEATLGPVSAAAAAIKDAALPSMQGVLAAHERLGLGAAMAAAAESQRLQLTWLEATPRDSSLRIERMLGENLVGTSRLVADLSAISSAARLANGFAGRWQEAVVRAAATITEAHHRQIRTGFARLGDALNSAQPGPRVEYLVAHEVAVTTYTSSRFVDGARDLIMVNTMEDDDQRDDVSAAHRRAASLEDQLAKLGPRFVAMWQRAWANLETGDPTAVRDVAHSARELLRQVLKTLAPDDCFTGGQKITREMRVNYIIGARSDSGREWARAVAKGLSMTYDLLSGDAHSERDDPRFGYHGMVGLLEALGGFLRFLLDFTQPHVFDDQP